MKQYQLKIAYFEPLYSVFLNTQNSSKVMFKKKSCKHHISKKNHAQRIQTEKIYMLSACDYPPPPLSHQI